MTLETVLLFILAIVVGFCAEYLREIRDLLLEARPRTAEEEFELLPPA